MKKPIEQNVQSTRIQGVYELSFIEKATKPLAKFKMEAERYSTIVENKTEEEVEKLFWKSLHNSSPVYGSDISGSLFDPDIPWNLS